MRFSIKTLFWLCASLALAVLLLILALRTTGTDRWEDARNRILRLKMEAKMRKSPRSELRGKLLSGDAWEEYTPAINQLVALNDDATGAIYALFVNSPMKEGERAKVRKLVASRAAAIEHLQRGAQRANGQYRYNWERSPNAELPSLLGSRKLANLAAAQARILWENGKTQEAVDLLLDATVFARDLGTNGIPLAHLIGAAVYTVEFTELKNLIASGKLSKSELAALAKQLEIVEHDLPAMSTTLANETLNFGMAEIEAFDGGLSNEEWQGFVKHDWSILLSPRTKFAEAFEEKDGHLKRLQKLEPMSYADAKKEAAAIDAEALHSSNYISQMGRLEISRFMVVEREVRAQVRLLRAAAIFLSTGQQPEIADPFGNNLLFSQQGGKTKIWSVGSDGTNQNGANTWEDGKPDIVLEIP